jgi:hypothetical protein
MVSNNTSDDSPVWPICRTCEHSMELHGDPLGCRCAFKTVKGDNWQIHICGCEIGKAKAA